MPLPIINQPAPSFDETAALLEKSSLTALSKKPMQGLKQLPHMVGITKKDAKWLKIKALKYIIQEDKGHRILKGTLRRPLYHALRYLRSFFTKQPFSQDGDLFFYGVKNIKQFIQEAKTTPLLVGFSYCQKPHECPSGRFNDQCLRDFTQPICNQCDIGKIATLLPPRSSIVIIPTVHHIGQAFFDKMPEKPLFLITACEMSLKMFADFGNMLGIRGIGIRLNGRICNTMKAFVLSEKGIKPGLTVLTSSTYHTILKILQSLSQRPSCFKANSK